MKILTVDLESAPNLAHTWGIWQQNVGLPQLIQPGYVMCFAAKWYHEPDVMFHRGKGMTKAIHKLLGQADVVVTWNGDRFDLPYFHTEFVKAGMPPPAPYRSLDLLPVVRRAFKFQSNKLDFIASELLGERKIATGGHETWIGCMANNADAWAKMESYNRHDVVLTERLYDVLKPWVKAPPNPALYGDADVAPTTCPQCGSAKIKKSGIAYTQLSAYQRYQCTVCQRWMRGQRRHLSVDAR